RGAAVRRGDPGRADPRAAPAHPRQGRRLRRRSAARGRGGPRRRWAGGDPAARWQPEHQWRDRPHRGAGRGRPERSGAVSPLDARWAAARRVLVIRLDNLGDVLLTTPAIHAIRASLPEAEITLLAGPVGAQAGRLNPDLDDVIVYQAPWMDPWSRLPHDSRREQHMIARLKARRFDGAITFTSFRQSPLPAAYLCYLADIPLRVAASIDGPGSLLTTRHKHPERMMHEVERGLDLVGAIGMDTAERDLVLSVPDSARAAVADRLADIGALGDRPLVVLHPGCSMPARTYSWEQYAEVTALLIGRLGATVALTGVAEERPLVERIRLRLRPALRERALPLAGDLDFPGLCA